MKANKPTTTTTTTKKKSSVISSSIMPGELVETDDEEIFKQYIERLESLRIKITGNLRNHILSTDDLREAEALINLAEGLARTHRFTNPKWGGAVVGLNYHLGGLSEINEMLREKRWPVDSNGHPSDRLSPRLEAILWF